MVDPADSKKETVASEEEADVDFQVPMSPAAPPELMDSGVVRGELEVFRRLLAINRTLNSEHDPERLLEVILEEAISLSEAERAFLILLEEEESHVSLSRNRDQEPVPEADSQYSRTIVEDVAETGVSVLSDTGMEDDRFRGSESLNTLKVRSVVCVPLRLAGEIVGVVYLDNRMSEKAFNRQDVWHLEAFADQAGIALRNARLFRQAERLQEALEARNIALEASVEAQRAEVENLRASVGKLPTREELNHPYPEILGHSPALLEALKLLDRVVETEYTVLLRGENGVGKELFARALHTYGPRSDGPFHAENFAAIPDSLLESELFGHVRGAFTGAERDRPGLFEIAAGGTLFLDEIGDVSLSMQQRLLRVLETGEVRRVGGQETIEVDVRIVTATNQDLSALIQAGEFREDLYYRLRVVEIEVPPLRKRPEDIPLLIRHFLKQQAAIGGKEKELTREALELLVKYPWPGNVRELKNSVPTLYLLSDDGIDAEVVESTLETSLERKTSASPSRERRPLDEVEREHILNMYEACDESMKKTAEVLGIGQTTLWRRLKEYGVKD